MRPTQWRVTTYGNTIRILLADTLGLSLTLLKGVLVLELGSHDDGYVVGEVEVGCGFVNGLVVGSWATVKI